MEKLEQQVNQLVKDNDRQDTIIDDHGRRIVNLEKFKTSSEVEIRNLIEQIKTLVSTIQWFTRAILVGMAGIIIWYLKNLGGN